MQSVLGRDLDRCPGAGGYLAPLFRIQLLDRPERFAVLRAIPPAGDLRRGWLVCAPDRDVAVWVLDHRGAFPAEPRVDRTSWDPASVGGAR